MSKLKFALLVPLYEAKERSLEFLKIFKEDDFDYFVLVNDGSSEEYDEMYSRIDNETVFNVVSYRGNMGKGFALKFGIKKILYDHKDVDFIITADGDGQHCYEDILRLKEKAIDNPHKLILGNRDLKGDNVPSKSKAGNNLSNFYFKVATLRKIDDTQTGLRAIPNNLFDLAISIKGDRYDYEMNFLIEANKAAQFVGMPIKTIYEDNNSGSHFHPIRDTFRIYRYPTNMLIITLASLFLDLFFFAISYKFFFNNDALLSSFLAGTISSLFSFIFVTYIISINSKNLAAISIFNLIFALVFFILGILFTHLFTFTDLNMIVARIIVIFSLLLIAVLFRITYRMIANHFIHKRH